MTDKEYAHEVGMIKLFFLYRLIQKLNIMQLLDSSQKLTSSSHDELAQQIRREIKNNQAKDTPFPAYIQKLLDIRSGIK
jgi:hypothetical protein